MNPWDVLKNNDFGISSGNDILLGTSGSMYRVILIAAVVGLACTLTYSFIRMALMRSSHAREEEKKEITGKMAVAALIFGGGAVLSLIWKIAESLLNSV